jgi:hypothetical protein
MIPPLGATPTSQLAARSLTPTTTDPSRAEAGPLPGIDGPLPHDIHVRLAVLIHDVQNRPPTEIAKALGELTVTAIQYVPRAQYAGITVTDGRGRIDTPSAAGRYPRLLDAIQQRHHEGPCLQAVRQQHTVRVDDLNTETRWPRAEKVAVNQLSGELRQFAIDVRQLGNSLDRGVGERERLELSERMHAAVKQAEARMASAESTPLFAAEHQSQLLLPRNALR